jgi:UDP-N-acetylenolpyruvoylglucosamine reductase
MISLMQEVQQRVRDKYGVSIEPEVQIVGEEEEQ